MVTESDLALRDGRVLHVYDTRRGRSRAPGSPSSGTTARPTSARLPEPLFPASARRGIRWVSYDRPGYGGSTPRRGRNVASAAGDVAAIADALGLEQFAVMGHSGGGPHALACAALLPDRVLGVVCVAGLAPLDGRGLGDWFAGMADSGAAELRAAVAGRAALASHLASTAFDPELFTSADHAALAGAWSWLGSIARKASEGGPDGMVDDDLAFVAPWGFDPGQVTAPILFLQGGQDRIVPSTHATWLARQLQAAELWPRPDDGHVSILHSAAAALDWLQRHARASAAPGGSPGARAGGPGR